LIIWLLTTLIHSFFVQKNIILFILSLYGKTGDKMAEAKKVAFTTLGCKLNFSETSGIAQQFEINDYIRVDDHEAADIFVINTCTVTELANRKSRQAIRKLINRNPDAYIIAIGCYSELSPDEVASIEGVDLVFGSENKFEIIDYLKQLNGDKRDKPIIVSSKNKELFKPVYSYGDRTRSFLKVQDGCDYYCSYCTIPIARGRSRNNTIANTVAAAREVVEKGIKEIILTGVNIGDFGCSTKENFLDLLLNLEQVEGLERLRISSIEPNLLTDQIIEHVARSKVIVPHFHIPLQCGTDDLLRSMRRRYTTAFYAKRVMQIKNLMPDACIAADVIVGVPGETETAFEDTCRFVESLPVSYLHVFPYSVRNNTLAAKMPNKVPIEVRKQRSLTMIALGNKKTDEFIQEQIGKIRPVLFESEPFNTYMYGFTDNYIKIKAKASKECINQVKLVKLTRYLGQNVASGEIIQ
jgi:threonylcarbamoyladenosine tRNA methylthiotransferase MtaB